LLTSRNWLAEDENKVKYYLCRKGEYPKEITKQEYRAIWREFYQGIEAGEEEQEMRIDICQKYGGMPRRQYGLTRNAFERDKLDALYDILWKFGQNNILNHFEATRT
jgi:hypothetical protein